MTQSAFQISRERDAAEQAALRDGEYVGVRRFVLTLENGYDAKYITDLSVDRCGQLINLRTAIMRYRTPQGTSRFHRYALEAADNNALVGNLDLYARVFGDCYDPSEWHNAKMSAFT